jgi:ribose-phosphate pyrophosphokinase
MKPIIFDFPTSSPLGNHLRKQMDAEEGKYIFRSFPDGETYLRIESHVSERVVIVNASLFRPNDWFLSLLFFADALRSQGTKRVVLLAPYLSYMRQDKIFQSGEALTSATFARLISSYFDSLVTVDPHLHRQL